MGEKKVIYIAGPITGVPKYWEAFEKAEDDLIAMGYIPLSPAHLPEGMTNDKYARIDFAMIDCADAVLFLPGYDRSKGAMLEAEYCKYTNKPVAALRSTFAEFKGEKIPREVELAWLKNDLKEVMGE